MAVTVTDGQQDQRNHGQRTVDKRANRGWSRNPDEHNESFARVSASLSLGAGHPSFQSLFANLISFSHRTVSTCMG